MTSDAFGRLQGASLARYCRTHPKTLWRWKVGEDLPGPIFAKRLLIWAQKQDISPT